MRGDLHYGQSITLPPTPTVATAAGGLAGVINQKDSSIFQGSFQIFGDPGIHHVGNYKSPDAHAWITVLDCFGAVGVSDGMVSSDTGTSPPAPSQGGFNSVRQAGALNSATGIPTGTDSGVTPTVVSPSGPPSGGLGSIGPTQVS
jgi:hypothetical protein